MVICSSLPQATDEDEQGTPNSNITYSLLPSTTPPGLVGHFEINPLTGDLVVKMSLDFDAMSTRGRSSETLTLTVEARDQGTVPLSSTVDVTITLLVRLMTSNFLPLFYIFLCKRQLSIDHHHLRRHHHLFSTQRR